MGIAINVKCVLSCFSLNKPERIQAGEAVKYFGETPSRRHVQYERCVISCLGPLSMLANAPDVTKGPWRDAC